MSLRLYKSIDLSQDIYASFKVKIFVLLAHVIVRNNTADILHMAR